MRSHPRLLLSSLSLVLLATLAPSVAAQAPDPAESVESLRAEAAALELEAAEAEDLARKDIRLGLARSALTRFRRLAVGLDDLAEIYEALADRETDEARQAAALASARATWDRLERTYEIIRFLEAR